MRLRETTGIDALRGSICAAQQGRLHDPTGGVWEAADLAWWWRQARTTDSATTRLWVDGDVPVRAVRPIAWGNHTTVEVVGIPEAVPADTVADAIETTRHETGASGLGCSSDVDGHLHDADLLRALMGRGWRAEGPTGGGGWTSRSPRSVAMPSGVAIRSVEREQAQDHHMAQRIGSEVQERLRSTGLYRDKFDVVAVVGSEVVGHALGWLDHMTARGFIEPVGVRKSHRRRGIATAMVAEVTSRLLRAGADRVRINWELGTPAETIYRALGYGDHLRMSALRPPEPTPPAPGGR